MSSFYSIGEVKVEKNQPWRPQISLVDLLSSGEVFGPIFYCLLLPKFHKGISCCMISTVAIDSSDVQVAPFKRRQPGRNPTMPVSGGFRVPSHPCQLASPAVAKGVPQSTVFWAPSWYTGTRGWALPSVGRGTDNSNLALHTSNSALLAATAFVVIPYRTDSDE